jgi:hypothetical protein
VSCSPAHSQRTQQSRVGQCAREITERTLDGAHRLEPRETLRDRAVLQRTERALETFAVRRDRTVRDDRWRGTRQQAHTFGSRRARVAFVDGGEDVVDRRHGRIIPAPPSRCGVALCRSSSSRSSHHDVRSGSHVG